MLMSGGVPSSRPWCEHGPSWNRLTDVARAGVGHGRVVSASVTAELVAPIGADVPVTELASIGGRGPSGEARVSSPVRECRGPNG